MIMRPWCAECTVCVMTYVACLLLNVSAFSMCLPTSQVSGIVVLSAYLVPYFLMTADHPINRYAAVRWLPSNPLGHMNLDAGALSAAL
jgi:hypothetical protein